MPKIIKKRPAKKRPVEETEEVKSAALHAFDAVKNRQRQVLTILSVIAVIALAAILFKFNASSQSKKANELEMQANNIYYPTKPDSKMSSTEKWRQASELYKKALDVKVTPTALFYLGNCYYNLGDYENAIKQYNTFADKFKSDDLILPLVYQKLASAYFKAGKNDKALEALAGLSRIKNGAFRDTALSMEARYYENTGNAAKAQEKFKELAGSFPNSPWSPEATAKVSMKTRTDSEPATGPETSNK